MLRKSLLSLAVAASVASLSGCNISSVEGNQDVDQAAIETGQPGFVAKGGTFVVFSASNSQLPLTTDLIFASAAATDGTAEVGDSSSVTAAVSDLDGFSTNAAIDIPVSSALTPASVQGGAVFLLELRSGAGIDALDINSIIAATPTSAAHPFADPGDQLQEGVDYSVSYLELDGGNTPTIRINQLKPLTPKAKFLVVVTGKVKDAAGDSIRTSPEYEHLSTTDLIASEQLQPVRDAIHGWEQLATAALAPAGVTKDNIAVSFTFTTGGTTDVLTSMAAPESFMATQLTPAQALATIEGKVAAGVEAAVTANEGLITAGVEAGIAAAVTEGIKTQVATGVLNGAEVEASEDNIAAVIAGTFPVAALNDAYTASYQPAYDASYAGAYATALEAEFQTQFDAARANTVTTEYNAAITATLAGANAAGAEGSDEFNREVYKLITGAGLNLAVDIPAPRTFTPIPGVVLTSAQIGLPDTGATFMQGGLEVPMFLPDPGNNTFWTGSADAAPALQRTAPPADADGSFNVTYRYPFAQKLGTHTIPVLVTIPTASVNPTCVKPAEGWPVSIIQHGTPTDRTATIGISNTLASQCIASVAIDHPMHGVSPVSRSGVDGSDTDNALMVFNVDYVNPTNTAQTSPFAATVAGIVGADGASPLAALRERHFDLTTNAVGATVAMDFDGTVAGGPDGTPTNGADGSPSFGKTGSLYINLASFQRTRDSIRQGVLDLMNLNASLNTMDVDGGGADFDTSKVSYFGHSLGGIVGTTFVSVNNSADVQAYRNTEGATNGLPKIQSVVLAHPGAQLPRLLENSPSFSPSLLAGLATVPDVNLEQGYADLEGFLTVFQATIDSADPVNFAKQLTESGTPVLMYEVVGGGAVTLGAADGDASKLAFFYGTGLQTTYLSDSVVPNGATAANIDVLPTTAAAPTAVARQATAFSPLAGTDGLITAMGLTTEINAGSPATITAADLGGTAGQPIQTVVKYAKGTHGSVANADDVKVFTEMMGQSISFILSNGLQVNNTNAGTDVLAPAPAQ